MTDELNIGSIDIAGMQNEAARLEDQNQGNDEMFIRMPEKEGSKVVRILPPSKGHKLYCKTRVHKINGRNVHCLLEKNERTDRWEGNCEICNYYRWLYKQVDKLESEGNMQAAKKKRGEAKLIKPIERTYFNAVDRSDDTPKPKILSVGVKLFAKIIRAFTGDKKFNQPPLGDITDWKGKTGRDLLIIKELTSDGKNTYPNYDRSQFNEPSPLADKETVIKLMENLHDLSKLRNVKGADYVKKELAIYRGLITDDSVGFNPENFDKEFQGANQSVEKTVPKETPATASNLAEAVSDSEPEGESIDVDDFFNTMNSMDLD